MAPEKTAESEVARTDRVSSFRPWHFLCRVEQLGIEPVPVDHKTQRSPVNLTTLWFSMNFNLIAISTGMAGTLSYGLGLRDCSLVILFFSLLTALCAPLLSYLGAALGLRQMVHARYAFGLFGSILPLALNMATLAGYGILDFILGGQALAAIRPGHLSVNVGIVIVALVNLVIITFGAHVIHRFDRYAWFPTLVAVAVAVGCGGRHLSNQAEAPPATARSVLGFGALMAGYFLPWSAIASDFTTYYDARLPLRAVFLPSYLGLLASSVPLMVLGAAIGGAVPQVPAWTAGYESNNVGGVLGAMLEPAHGFGSFLLVLLTLSVLGNVVGSLYALTLNLQAVLQLLLPARWRARVHRVLAAVLVTAVLIPVAIKVARDFFVSLSNFLGIIGYWPASFVAVVGVEHVVFRGGRADAYDLARWDVASALPGGAAALAAMVASFGLVVPCMDQMWFAGPIAQRAGDMGFEVAFVLTAVLYMPLRWLERQRS